jgi:hypothetical protein
MAIFQAFFDESGKFKDKHVISFCGLCSPLARIRAFEEDWKGLLGHFGLQSLSMKRALRHKIKLSQSVEAKSAPERNKALEPFAESIRKHFELGVAVTVDVDAYEKWPTYAKKKMGGSDNPHYFAFLSALMISGHYLQDEDRLGLVCDDDRETAINCYGLYQRVRTVVSDLRNKLVAITFADDNEVVPLQAADMLSSLCRLEAGRKFHREYFEYVPLFNSLTAPSSSGGIKWGVRFYSKEHLEDLARRMRKLR